MIFHGLQGKYGMKMEGERLNLAATGPLTMRQRCRPLPSSFTDRNTWRGSIDMWYMLYNVDTHCHYNKSVFTEMIRYLQHIYDNLHSICACMSVLIDILYILCGYGVYVDIDILSGSLVPQQVRAQEAL